MPIGSGGAVGAATYDCGFGGHATSAALDNFGDGEDSGYTEIPVATDSSLRDRIARLVFRQPQSQQPQHQQHQQQQQPPPPRSLNGRLHRAAASNFPGYAYTRWECLPAASATPPPTRSNKPPPAAASGQRTVRFRCPREQPDQKTSKATAATKAIATAAKANVDKFQAGGDTDSDRRTIVQPYSTFAASQLPPAAGRLGERSASSGYGSDVDIVGGGGAGDLYAVREEDIDRLLLSSAASRAAPVQDEVDVLTLDVTAYFPPSDANSQGKLDRLVGDVVRMKSAAAAALTHSPRGPPRQQRHGCMRDLPEAQIELSDLPKRTEASRRYYY